MEGKSLYAECIDLRVSQASFSYGNEILSIKDASVSIPKGSFTCIVGPNGSGKSTLAKLCSGLYLPSSGTVEVLGQDTSEPKDLVALRSSVGLVMQNPEDQLICSIVEADTAFGPENLALPPEEISRRVTFALERVGLGSLAKHQTATLSGGQKQRLAIAGALAMEPAILITDEATSMLDPVGRHQVMKILHALHQAGTTIIHITHDLTECEGCDQVLAMHEGQVAYCGSLPELLAQPELMEHCALVASGSGTGKAPAAQHDEGADGANGAAVNNPTAAAQAYTGATAGTIKLGQVFFSYEPATKLKKRLFRTAQETSIQPTWALEGISLDIPLGSFFGIAGATGSGKSTLLQLLDGLLEPTKGTLSLPEQIASRRNACAYLFQYPERQLFATTVTEDIGFGPKNLGWDSARIENAVHQALEQVGLDDSFLGKNPHRLSGGQKRRVAMAGALACRPDILILDEPAAGLDPIGHQHMMELLQELHTQGITIVMASHCMEDLAVCCTHLAVLGNGTCLATGKPSDVFQNHQLMQSAGLEVAEADT